MKGSIRKAEILDAALCVATHTGFENATREQVAKEAGCAEGLVSNYWGTMKQLRRAIMREAIRTQNLVVIAQGLARGNSNARKAPPELKERAAAQLTSV